MNTVRAYIDHHAVESPDSVFLITPADENSAAEELTFAGLKVKVDLIGEHLSSLGIEPQAKVAFLLNNGQWTTQLFLGVMANRRVIVPINAVAGETQMQHVLNHCDAEVVFVATEYKSMLSTLIDKSDRKIEMIEVDEKDGPQWPALQDSVLGDAATVNTVPTEQDQALLLYTSGSTGLPKGAILSQLAVINGGRNVMLGHDLKSADRVLCVLPVYHINGAMVTVAAPLVSGSSVVMPRKFSVKLFWLWVAEYGCTWSSIVPTIIKYLLDRADAEDFDFGNDDLLEQFRFARSASAPLPAVVLKQWEETFYTPMIETLGLTETAGTVASNPMPPDVRKPGSVGKAVGNEIEIGDENGELLPAQTIGELLIRGDNVLSEYYKNPQATDGAFVNGWFRTGDLGVKDKEGYIFITGRLKELIIRGGENIAPREIDDVLYKHDAILEAAAFGLDDDSYGQEVYACVALREGHNCTEEELMAFCESGVGKVKMPKKFYFLDELPKGPSGKILRLKLPEIINNI